MRLLLVVGALAMMFSCGGAQQEARGEVFCQSYERDWVLECRKSCEQNLDSDDAKGVKACEKKCRKELRDDDIYSSDCLD